MARIDDDLFYFARPVDEEPYFIVWAGAGDFNIMIEVETLQDARELNAAYVNAGLLRSVIARRCPLKLEWRAEA